MSIHCPAYDVIHKEDDHACVCGYKQSRYQVIIKHGDRSWDSIRETPEAALERIAVYMQMSMRTHVYTTGKRIKEILSYGGTIKGVTKAMTKIGFTVTVKEL